MKTPAHDIKRKKTHPHDIETYTSGDNRSKLTDSIEIIVCAIVGLVLIILLMAITN